MRKKNITTDTAIKTCDTHTKIRTANKYEHCHYLHIQKHSTPLLTVNSTDVSLPTNDTDDISILWPDDIHVTIDTIITYDHSGETVDT